MPNLHSILYCYLIYNFIKFNKLFIGPKITRSDNKFIYWTPTHAHAHTHTHTHAHTHAYICHCAKRNTHSLTSYCLFLVLTGSDVLHHHKHLLRQSAVKLRVPARCIIVISYLDRNKTHLINFDDAGTLLTM